MEAIKVAMSETEWLRQQLKECLQAMVELSKSNTDAVAAYSAMRAERDDLAAKNAALNAELHELRIRAGTARKRRTGEPQRRRA